MITSELHDWIVQHANPDYPLRVVLAAGRRAEAVQLGRDFSNEIAIVGQRFVAPVHWYRTRLLPMLERRTFARADIVRQARQAIGRLTPPPAHHWLIASVEEFESSDLDSCAEPVPVDMHLEASRMIFGPLLSDIPHFENGCLVHAAAVDCSYPDVTATDEVLKLFLPYETEVFRHDTANTNVILSYAALETALSDSGTFARDAIVVRLTLIRAAVARAFTNDTTLTVDVARVLKRGNVLLLKVRKPFSNTAYRVWCKFGSFARLSREHKLSNEFEIAGRAADYLYHVKDVQRLAADYTAVLLSVDAAPGAEEVFEFGEWVVGASDSELQDVLADFKRFLDDLHGRVMFGSSLRRCVTNVVWTRRAAYSDDELLIPDPDGDELQHVEPRDADGAVSLVLRTAKGEVRFVDWSRSDWRWRLWKNRVGERPGVRLRFGNWNQTKREQFFAEHFGETANRAAAAAAVQVSIRQYLSERGRVGTALGDDLLADASHGDFHPRNALLIPAEGQRKWKLRVIDLADAVSPSSDHKEPLAHDYATFEVDLHLRALFDAAVAATADPDGVLSDTLAFERAAWSWVLSTSDGPKLTRSLLECWSQFPLDVPMRTPLRPVALWRNFAVRQICDAVGRVADVSDRIACAPWHPAASYAESLFLWSIAYLEYLDPHRREDALRAVTCLAMAKAADEVLASFRSTRDVANQ